MLSSLPLSMARSENQVLAKYHSSRKSFGLKTKTNRVSGNNASDLNNTLTYTLPVRLERTRQEVAEAQRRREILTTQLGLESPRQSRRGSGLETADDMVLHEQIAQMTAMISELQA